MLDERRMGRVQVEAQPVRSVEFNTLQLFEQRAFRRAIGWIEDRLEGVFNVRDS